MKKAAGTIDAYLAQLDETQRATLETIRKTIHAAIPEVEECISYSVPAFRIAAGLIAGLSTSKEHCSFHPMSGTVVGKLKRELAAYETAKGTIRFPSDEPLPATLIRKLLKTRIAELAPKKKTKR